MHAWQGVWFLGMGTHSNCSITLTAAQLRLERFLSRGVQGLPLPRCLTVSCAQQGSWAQTCPDGGLPVPPLPQELESKAYWGMRAGWALLLTATEHGACLVPQVPQVQLLVPVTVGLTLTWHLNVPCCTALEGALGQGKHPAGSSWALGSGASLIWALA